MIIISPQQRKLIQIVSFYFTPLFLTLFSVLFATDDFFVKFGEIAVLLVIANLFLKPVSVIITHPFLKPLFAQALTFRREVGVMSFWFFVFHIFGMILGRGLSLSIIYNPQGFIIWGSFASIGMWILGLTSNNFSQRLLKKNWKKVQMLAYLVLPLATFHAAKAEGEYSKFILINGVFIGLKIAQYAVSRQRRAQVKNT